MRTILYKSQLDQRGAKLARMPERTLAGRAKATNDPVDEEIQKAIRSAESGTLSLDERAVLLAAGMQKHLAVFHRDLFQGLQAVHRKTGIR